MKSIDEYLDTLEEKLRGSDPATIKDARSDAEEHLRTAIDNLKDHNSEMSDSEALSVCIEDYGTPEEIASAYKQVEDYLIPMYPSRKSVGRTSSWGKVFGIVADPRAWGSMLYMFLSLLTGIVYFTWAITGVSLSVSLSILIFGIPVAILFLLSVRGLSFLEGRLVEGLLGVQMPRRMSFTHPDMKLIDRLKNLATDRYTWFSILYMILLLPLGVVYFTLEIVLISLALGVIAIPIVQTIFSQPTIYINSGVYYFPVWSYPFVIVGGILIFLGTMHLSKLIGYLHGRFAKALLVGS